MHGKTPKLEWGSTLALLGTNAEIGQVERQGWGKGSNTQKTSGGKHGDSIDSLLCPNQTTEQKVEDYNLFYYG